MAEEKQSIKAMLKSEYAERVGIPASTLRRYMNSHFIHELASLGYTKSQKYLMPNQIKYLNAKLVVE